MAEQQIRARRYPFLPMRLQGGAFMTWLKRLHGWIGIWGAVVGVIIGITGITLNHRGAIQAGNANTVEQWEIEVPAGGFADDKEFDEYVSSQLGLDPGGEVRPPRRATDSNAKGVRYGSASIRYDVTYIPGNAFMSVTKTNAGVISTMNSLHLGNRSGLIWVLVLDAFAGSLIFLAITGILLWSKLHGTALVAVSLMMSFFGGAFYFAAVL